MDLEDTITIATPEGLGLAVSLAGLGSRFIAGMIDLVIQLVAIVVLGVLTAAIGSGGGFLGVVFVIGTFLIWFFYFVLFEVLNAGRTPGKAASHLRVVRESGAPVDFTASAIRNLVRVVDGLLLFYLPSMISIAITAKNQRPGDLAAGTIVIREQRAREAVAIPPSTVAPAGSWDLSAITVEETAAVRRFLERRSTLEPRARYELALRLASGLRTKASGAPEGLDPERFLEALVAAKTSRR